MNQDSIHVVCPHCDSVNRLPRSRLQNDGKCGRCKNPLFSGTPLTLTANNFQRHISRNDIPLVIDFWASWCGPCKMFAPVFAEAAGEIEPRARLAKVDTEAQPQLAQQFQIRSIPTLMVIQNGREITRQAGAMDKSQFLAWLEPQLIS